MRTNRVKRKLNSGEPTFGVWLSLGDHYATRTLARMPWDWLTLDMEHSPIDWNQAAILFGAIADAGGVPLARVPRGDHDLIKRALDAGAWGIVVPMVDTVEQAKAAIAAAKYPPQGSRSVGGGMHSMNFDATPEEYYAHANDEILVVLQTESPLGVANAKEIYALPGCDAIFIGPNDLWAQMKTVKDPSPTKEGHEALIQQVIATGKEVGTPTGMHVLTAEQALSRAEQGMQFIAVGSDVRMMAVEAEATLQKLRPDQDTESVVAY
ncbi:HpcH/HpaI aldolase family protein [Blastopirellula retiformator]|uniref:5-keto-4-deoxy-D-glucarate aldolase n=1 Tax=Blastopirellula retiformator TaxID=2527970 RepID=A0A5C5V253_9BACT|nr:aldolase/citrate lyase family protein [Blastopirellula retiformator]TWT31877.1 5-keto-4-deoxy-D-glucarate aldolase [Blastopirellula retiformator]